MTISRIFQTLALAVLMTLPLLAVESQYDPRDHNLVTAAKKQDSDNCWSYAAVGSMEANILRQRLLSDPSSSDIDLSEYHLRYFTIDPTDPQEKAGGSSADTVQYLTRGQGMVLEADGKDLNITHPPVAWRLWEQRYLDLEDATADDLVSLKEAILLYGSVELAVNWRFSAWDGSGDHPGYFQPDDSGNYSGHALAIVGWDDTYQVNDAPNPGAWLVKNSWKSGFGNGRDRFFYMAYDSHDFANDWGVNWYRMRRNDGVTDVLQHQDKYPGWFIGGFPGSPVGLAARFQQSNAVRVGAVGLWTSGKGTVTVRIHNGWNNGPGPVLSEQELAADANGYGGEGYRTVTFPEAVEIPAHQEFVITLVYSGEAGSARGELIQGGTDADLSYKSIDTTTGTDGSWSDLGASGAAAIKAILVDGDWDATPPVWKSEPALDWNGTSAVVDCELDEVGHIFWVVTPADEAIPDALMIRAGLAANGGNAKLAGHQAVSGSPSEFMIDMADLEGSEDWVCHIIAQDRMPNIQTSVTTLALIKSTVSKRTVRLGHIGDKAWGIVDGEATETTTNDTETIFEGLDPDHDNRFEPVSSTNG